MSKFYQFFRARKIGKTFLLFFIFCLVNSSFAFALPTGPQVESGTVKFHYRHNVLVIKASPNAIIDWQSFNIGVGQRVRFIESSLTSMVLNRVLNGSASYIAGALSANGGLIFINPAGINFASTAQISMSSFIASTLNISSGDFLSEQYHFARGAGDPVGMVTNNGKMLAAPNGFLLLLGGAVANTGTLTAKLGTVAMASGDKATVTVDNNQLLSVVVDEATQSKLKLPDGTSVTDAVKNKGTISAPGGTVLLSAQTLSDVFDNSINQQGMISATSVGEKNGKVILNGGNQSIVSDSGTIDVSGKDAGETGGNVEVIGQDVGLFGNASIDASGASGGGTIHIGRDAADPNAFEAEMTIIDPDVVLNASATQSGNGGFIETSGQYIEEYTSNINAQGAGGGAMGNWLLDPWNVTISGGPSTYNGSFDGGSPTNTFTPSATGSAVGAPLIDNILDGTGGQTQANVTITTTGSGSEAGNITVSSPISWTSTSTLTLDAANNIVLTDGITNSSSGNLALEASGTISGSGDINLTSGSVSVAGTDGSGSAGSTTLNSTQALALGAVTSSGDINITTSGDLSVNGTIETSKVSGAINLTAGSTSTLTQNSSGPNHGNIQASGANSIAVSLSAGSIGQNDVALINTNGGSVAISGGGSGGISLNTSYLSANQLGTLTGSNLSGSVFVVDNGTSLNLGNMTFTGAGSLSVQIEGSAASLTQTSGTTINSDGNSVTLKSNTGSINQNGTLTTGGGAVTLSLSSSGHSVLQNGTGAINSYDGSSAYGLVLVTNSVNLSSATEIINFNGSSNEFQNLEIEHTSAMPSSNAQAIALTVDDNQALNFGEYSSSASRTHPDTFSSVNIDTSAGNGAIAQTVSGGTGTLEALDVTGTTTLNAGTNDITLTSTSNDFGDQSVTLTGGNINLVDNDVTGLLLGNLAASGNLDIEQIAGNDIIQAVDASITMTGIGDLAGFDASNSNATGQVLLGNSGNNFNGNAISVGEIGDHAVGNVTINDASSNILLGNINAAGDLLVAAQGNVTQVVSGTINDAGLTSITSATGSIDLTEGTNSFGRIAAATTNQDISITTTNSDLNITNETGGNGINAGTGTVTLTANNGAITDNNAVGYIVAGTTNLTATGTGGYIGLENITQNQFGSITASAADNNSGYGIILNDNNSNGVTVNGLDTSADDGNISLVERGTISSGSAITISGPVNAGDGGVVLNASGGGGITGSGAITTTYSTGLYAETSSGYVDLDGNNQFSAVSAITGGANGVTLNDVNNSGLTIDSIDTTNGGLSNGAPVNVTASGALSLAATATGTYTINAGNEGVTLTGASITGLTPGQAGYSTGAINTSTLTNLTATSGDINMTGANAFGTLTASASGDVALTDMGTSLTLGSISASGNVTILDQGGTIAFTGASPTIILTGNNKTATLSAQQFNNGNTTAGSAINLTGTNDAWYFYLANLNGNTFGNLSSGNQAIWDTAYPTAITQSGNRYIFATAGALTLAPESTPFALSKVHGDTLILPTPEAGTNYQAIGFVDAGNYGNVFTQDTVNNVPISGLSFASTGTVALAGFGAYAVTMTGIGTATNGYSVSYDPAAVFGNLTVNTPVNVPVSPRIVSGDIIKSMRSYLNDWSIVYPSSSSNAGNVFLEWEGVNLQFNEDIQENMNEINQAFLQLFQSIPKLN